MCCYYYKENDTVFIFSIGVFHSVTADMCLSSPCQNGGTCIDNVMDYLCICPADPLMYKGKNCELLYDACVDADCPNCISTPGTANYTCPCADGFGGPDCTLNADECESNPCTGIKSHCVDGINGYSCYCPSGYSGDDCQTRVRGCSDDPCFNNATCVWAPSGYECQCARGFQGSHCEQDIDECLSQPCQNGAICLDGIDVYQCFCVPGFQGYHCEIDINECASRPCENNGTCINEKDRYVCQCLLGFKGKDAVDFVGRAFLKIQFTHFFSCTLNVVMQPRQICCLMFASRFKTRLYKYTMQCDMSLFSLALEL